MRMKGLMSHNLESVKSCGTSLSSLTFCLTGKISSPPVGSYLNEPTHSISLEGKDARQIELT